MIPDVIFPAHTAHSKAQTYTVVISANQRKKCKKNKQNKKTLPCYRTYTVHCRPLRQRGYILHVPVCTDAVHQRPESAQLFYYKPFPHLPTFARLELGTVHKKYVWSLRPSTAWSKTGLSQSPPGPGPVLA